MTARVALRYVAGMTVEPSNKSADDSLVVETEPSAEDVRFLEDGLIDFNLQTTGITDGSFIGIFLRGSDGSRAGGLYGWVCGSTCYVRYLFVAESLRKQGQGTRLMRAVEAEARARNCRQIVPKSALAGRAIAARFALYSIEVSACQNLPALALNAFAASRESRLTPIASVSALSRFMTKSKIASANSIR